MIRYVLRQDTPQGHWISPEIFEARDMREVRQQVIAGYLMGQSRWAESESGQLLYGLDHAGKEMKG